MKFYWVLKISQKNNFFDLLPKGQPKLFLTLPKELRNFGQWIVL